EARHGRLFEVTERGFDAMLRGYERSLAWVLRHRPATMGVSLALLAVTGLLFVHVPKGFIPNEDQGLVFTVVEAAEGVSFEQITLQSPDTQALYQGAPRLEARLRALPELQDVTSDLQIKNPQVSVVIDRDKASTLGVSAEQIEDALFDAYGNRWVSTIYAPTN